ncbi:MAG TPA: hypothetical protein VF711_11500 [Acidimicrobiales bacterium]
MPRAPNGKEQIDGATNRGARATPTRASARCLDYRGRWPDGEAWPGGGRVTFEWHASGAHLVERGTVELPEAPDNVSIIGCDAANGTYFQLYSEERGVCRVYEMSIGDGEWKLCDPSQCPCYSRVVEGRWREYQGP